MRNYQVIEMNKDNNNLVSIIVRTIDNRLHFMERSLLSIFNNTHKDKEVIIVYQGTNNEYLNNLKEYIIRYPELNITVLQNTESGDQRTKNANWGIKTAQGRYLCFLDDDDIYYPNHITTLVETLKKTDKAWAYSQVCLEVEKDGHTIRKEYPYLSNNFSFKRFWNGNFIPIHTFMIDTYRIEDKSILTFNENLNKSEDYAFLLKIAYNYEPVCCTEVTCSYMIRTDGSNTNVNICKESAKNCKNQTKWEEWDSSGKILNEIKKSISSQHYWFNELVDPNYKDDRKILNLKTRLGKKFKLRISIEKN